jgi:hypothetical protein
MMEVVLRYRRAKLAREQAAAKGIQLRGIGVIAVYPRTEEKK